MSSSDGGSTDSQMATLVHDHLDAVWGTLRRLGVPESAVDDATQQVFLVAARKLTEIQRGAARSFLTSVALRVASDARRSLRRRREVPIEDAGAEPASPSDREAMPDVMLEKKRDAERLAAALRELPDEMQEAFVLFELEELSAPEVAGLLGIPVGTVASRVRRARELIRAQLTESGDEP
jgi:RNA polymerase sigma-70 factor (ECF subfamily)